MSTILKALRRLEHEKDADAARVRDQETLSPAAASELRSKRSIRRVVIAGVTATSIGVGLGLWMSGSEPEQAHRIAAAVGSPAPRVLAAVPARVPARELTQKPTRELTQKPTRVPMRVAAPVPKAEPIIAERAGPAAPLARELPKNEPLEVMAPPRIELASNDVEGDESPGIPISSLPPAPASTRRPAAGSAKTVAPPPTPSATAEHDAKAPSSAPIGPVTVQSADDRIEIDVVKTIWHPRVERRSARVRISEGAGEIVVHEQDEIGGGYRVVEITPSSVVLTRGDVTLTRRVGER